MTALRSLSAAPFPYRRNSLNMFRLVFAAMVLFAHSFYITGHGIGPQLNGENLGGWAVACFFVVSGFLITGSRHRTGAGDYILHRVARIMPGFVVCLLVTALVFGPISLLIEFGTLRGYASTPTTPAEYVWSNLALYINHYDIGRTLSTVPYPRAWNGSLWTLFYEFACYVLVWVACAWSLFRRTLGPVIVLFLLSVANWALISVAGRLGLDETYILFSKLSPFFIGGAVVFYVVERWGIHPLIGAASIPLALCCIVLIPHWGGQIGAPLLAYALLYLSAMIPQPAWIARNDISYGFYIYAWPVQQLVELLGGSQWGIAVYMVIATVLTAALATVSWFVVERPAMRRVRGRGRQSSVPVVRSV